MLAGRHVVVVGSAPLAAPLTVQASDYVVAVNGGISSAPLVDAWVLNARSNTDPVTVGRKAALHALMLAQGQGRRLALLLLLEKGEGAVAHTTRRLARLGVTWRDLLVLPNQARRRIEATSGARSPELFAHALSAGMFAAAWAFHNDAATVRLEGFSWRGGYAYTDTPVPTRGHEAGDKVALARLEARYGERLIHALTKERTMAKTFPKPAAAAGPSAAKQAAKAATTPAAERARKVARKAEQAAAPAKPRRLLVRATERTYYGLRRRRAGEVFQLRRETDFRPSCMAWAGPDDKPTPRPTAESARPPQLKPNAADVADPPPAGRPGANNPLGV